jgi:hypothetical protein
VSNQFVTAEEAKRCRIWTLYENDEIELNFTVKEFSKGVRHVNVFENDDRILASSEDHSVRVIDGKAVKCALIGHKDIVSCSDFVDMNTVITSSWDQTLGLYKIQ